MSDPRKPILRPPTDQEQTNITKLAYTHLMVATHNGAQEIGCTGAAFVVLGIGIWSAELAELDAKSASKMLAAISVIYDPTSNPTQKMHAEKKRATAVKKLFGAVDLAMTNPTGTA